MKKFISLVVAVILVVSSLALLVACNKVADNTEHFDDITKEFKLNGSYEGKNFLSDGIGRAKVDAYTDGDTTRFILDNGGETVIIRYFMINTPESTGSVEKWGKAASLWNKEQLSQADDIVLVSSTSTATTFNRPKHDSYGTRWLGYVWYRKGNEDFKCLNLETVENGFSANEGVNTENYPFWSYFDRAEKFAKSIKLRMWSDLDDPLFNTDPVTLTIKEFWNNIDAYYDSDTHNGAKVIFSAYITDLYISDTGTHTFTATEWDEETQQTYSVNVYAAYSSSYASNMKIGHLYRFIGTVQEFPEGSGKFQISGINYMPSIMGGGAGLTQVEQKGYYLTFNSGMADHYRPHYSQCFYSDLEVVTATLNGTTLTITGKAYQLIAREDNENQGTFEQEATTFTITVTVPANYTEGTIKAGSKLTFTGLQMVENSGNVTVLKYQDITSIK